jgi:hypothetical protein
MGHLVKVPKIGEDILRAVKGGDEHVIIYLHYGEFCMLAAR